jgi:hypothetical protein
MAPVGTCTACQQVAVRGRRTRAVVARSVHTSPRSVQAGRRLSASSWSNWTTAELLSTQCTPSEAFTHLTFAGARTVQSNLGGQGGRCVNTTYRNGDSYAWFDLCDEEQPAVNVPETAQSIGNMHLLVSNIGVTSEGDEISLLIRNESECA